MKKQLRKKIADKKSRAIINITLTIVSIVIGNGFIEYLKVVELFF